MSFTQAQLDALESAIAQGVTQVRFADGHSVQYASLDDMRRARTMIRQSLGLDPLPAQRRRYAKYESGIV